MVMLNKQAAKKIGNGAIVKFLQDSEGVLKGDIGTLNVEITVLPRGRGKTYRYSVLFDDGKTVPVDENEYLIVMKAPPKGEPSSTALAARKAARRVAGGLGRIGLGLGRQATDFLGYTDPKGASSREVASTGRTAAKLLSKKTTALELWWDIDSNHFNTYHKHFKADGTKMLRELATKAGKGSADASRVLEEVLAQL